MCQEHYKRFACGHKEKDISWATWISTRVCRGPETIEIKEELCKECKIYEAAKSKILAARAQKKDGSKEETAHDNKWSL